MMEKYTNNSFDINKTTFENQLQSDGYEVSVTTDEDENYLVAFLKTKHVYTVDSIGIILDLREDKLKDVDNYIKENLVLNLNAINNIKTGHSNRTSTWYDLSEVSNKNVQVYRI